jgi:hypothetical protein
VDILLVAVSATHPLPRPAKTGARPTATSAAAPKTMPPRATHHTPYLAFSAHCHISYSAEDNAPPGHSSHTRTSPSLPTASSATAPKTMPPRATHHTPYLAFSAHCHISYSAEDNAPPGHSLHTPRTSPSLPTAKYRRCVCPLSKAARTTASSPPLT